MKSKLFGDTFILNQFSSRIALVKIGYTSVNKISYMINIFSQLWRKKVRLSLCKNNISLGSNCVTKSTYKRKLCTERRCVQQERNILIFMP